MIIEAVRKWVIKSYEVRDALYDVRDFTGTVDDAKKEAAGYLQQVASVVRVEIAPENGWPTNTQEVDAILHGE